VGRLVEQDPDAAVRVDPDAGVEDIVRFAGPVGRRLFTTLHLPPGRPAASLVMCSSMHSEFERNYRREVVVARGLAARGIAVIRFHYRGTGNSDDGSEVTLDSMTEDASVATGWLAERTGVTPMFLGTRWGALVASAAANRVDGTPLVLWEPVVDAAAYFREAIRARAMGSLKEGGSGGRGAHALEEELARLDHVDVLGYPIRRALHDSAVGRTLAGQVGDRPRPILVVQLGGRPQDLKREYSAMVERWRKMGFPVETGRVAIREAWWFTGERYEPTERRPATLELAETTARWLLDRGSA
jgi:alpha/beta superfamily hydrolase